MSNQNQIANVACLYPIFCLSKHEQVLKCIGKQSGYDDELSPAGHDNKILCDNVLDK